MLTLERLPHYGRTVKRQSLSALCGLLAFMLIVAAAALTDAAGVLTDQLKSRTVQE